MHRNGILLAASLAVFFASLMTVESGRAARVAAAAAGLTMQRINASYQEPVTITGVADNHTAAQKTTAPIVTATLYDYDASGTTLLRLRSDHYNGNGLATYTASGSRHSSLSCGFDAKGEWVMNLGNQSLRTVYITPNAAIDTLQPSGPPDGYYSDSVTIRCGCFDQNGNIVPLSNIVTASSNCKLGINFDSGGTFYKLLMSPFPLSGSGGPPPTCPPTGCPATGVATVTCNAVNSNGTCVNWTIEPNATAPNAKVANLYRYYSAKGSATWIFIGQYSNSFRIGLTNQ